MSIPATNTRWIVSRQDQSELTRATYARCVRDFRAWLGAADGLPDADRLAEYRGLLAGKMRPASVRVHLAAIRQHIRELGAGENLLSALRSPRDRVIPEHEIVRRCLSPEEARDLAGSIASLSVRDRLVVSLALYQGLRSHEIAGLRMGSVDWDRMAFLDIFGKGGKHRRVRICGPVRDALEPFRNQVPGSSLIPGCESRRQVSRICASALEAIGAKRPGLAAHSLRHTHAVIAVLAGAQRESLRLSMGHTRMATTDIYTGAAAHFQTSSADAVAGLLA